MARLTRFVVPTKDDPNTKRIEISDGDHIVIKKRLTTGESKTIESANLRTLYGDRGPNGLPKIVVDLEGYALVKVFTWLTEWSLRDPQKPDETMPISLHSIAALDDETFAEIDGAIEAHQLALLAEKKRQAMLATTASPTSSATT